MILNRDPTIVACIDCAPLLNMIGKSVLLVGDVNL